MSAYDRFRRLLAGEPLPAALLDLDALEHNLDALLGRLAPGVTLRVATKSVRHTGVLRRLLDRGGERVRGLLCYDTAEAEWLADRGFDDLLVAYPAVRAVEVERIARLAARGVTVRAVVDHPVQIAAYAEAGRRHDTTVPLCLDVDVSWRPAPGVHLGARRSPVRSAEQAVSLAAGVPDGARITAVMAYEAQVAGVSDAQPAHRRAAVRLIKRQGRAAAAARRREVVRALRDAGHVIELVNGGGTGSVGTTSHDGTVTEVAAGSGFFCPHLFDGYRHLALRPAAFFALEVVRRSDPGFVTCAGGGYVASGATGPDRSPVVHLPRGLAPTALEGWGEVQTPLRCEGEPPALGDPVICRHAKAGELCERFADLLLFRGDAIVAREPTYRGEGATFA